MKEEITMSMPASTTILVASDSTTTATLVKKFLGDEFEHVLVSTHPEAAAQDFDRHRPAVLVLAFRSLEQSKRHNLGLYRQSQEIHRQPHRTLILCDKEELRQAYELCRDEIFDDYILFWPLAHDAPRLSMAVHHALRDLAVNREGGPTPGEFAAQVRHLAELESLLAQRMAKGGAHIESAGRAIAHAEQDMGAALAGFSRELSGLVEIRNAKALEQAFDRLKHESIEAPLHAVAESMHPLQQWADEVRQASAPHLESLRSLHALAERVRPTVMVVDDDAFQHGIVRALLKGEGYRLVFVTSGTEALNMLRKTQPELILMDLSMPDMDGLEVTRRVKGVTRFAHIPIIMITGNSEEDVVTDSLAAGAVDFMVKPLGREALTLKIAKVLGTKESPPAELLPELNPSDL